MQKEKGEVQGDLPVPDLRTMKELCQPSLNGRGGLISPIAIPKKNFGLKNDMIQQVQNSCHFHGLPGDDANKHLDKLLLVTQSIKLINEITNFPQRPDESLFEAWERYKLSIDRCSNHNMLLVTQIDTFYNGLTLRHHDTINAAAGGTFMKRLQGVSHPSITSSFDMKIAALKDEMAEINKNIMRFIQVNQQVKAVTPNCKTCGGPHSFSDCLATVCQTQNVYSTGAYQASMGERPREAWCCSGFTVNQQVKAVTPNYKTCGGQHSFNDCPATVGQTQNVYAAGAYQGNTITNPNEDLKGINTRSGTAYQGPTIPTITSSLPPVVERETEATKDTVHPTNNEITKDVTSGCPN
nr:hypothetical protein [Tanacetum cinerariifolium]